MLLNLIKFISFSVCLLVSFSCFSNPSEATETSLYIEAKKFYKSVSWEDDDRSVHFKLSDGYCYNYDGAQWETANLRALFDSWKIGDEVIVYETDKGFLLFNVTQDYTHGFQDRRKWSGGKPGGWVYE